MVDEVDNIVLFLLRDIRAKLDEHDKRFDHLEQLQEKWALVFLLGFRQHIENIEEKA